ncbi:MAG TPA: prepilin-type N-terminal cleavage/methylation domain-containing protein [Gemmatimonadaceae bacterium]|nr:prepilin-type N-terminal cleavage/methylation domain-containing protein [Gemmatimonadaceae bacterium]
MTTLQTSRQRRRSMRRRPAVGNRAGFTLVELIVAIMVLSIGLLGLAGSAAVLTRQINGGARMTVAASVARDRFEVLRARPCNTLPGQSGSAVTRGISESWRVTANTIGGRTASYNVVNVVSWHTTKGSHTRTFTTLIPCAIAA